MAEEDVAAAVASSEAPEPSPVSSDHKRKLEDLEPQEQEASETLVAASSSPSPAADPFPQDLNGDAEEADETADNLAPEVKRPRLEQQPESDGSVLENGHQVEKEENADGPPEVENPEVDVGERVGAETESAEHGSVENLETGDVSQLSSDNDVKPEDGQQALKADDREAEDGGLPPQGDVLVAQPQDGSESQTTSRKMEVPNNKVGVLIGKAGETIRLLQYNSGAKIQITRDSEADVYSSTRPVELIGTLESINKAEKLIKDVIAEADAGGSPSLVARGFGTVQASGAAEQIQIQVLNEKVGLIIGKGGETIKNLQTRSGARIQLIPQHLPEGDQSKERTVRVTGDKKQIEIAREMIKDVMNQVVRPSHHSGGGYNQQSHRPRGPNGPPQWGPRAPPTAQPTGYNYHHQRGMYPSHQNPQYQPSAYGGYPTQQPNPRGSYNAGWDQRPSGPMHGTPQGGGYDYYSQGGHMPDASASNPASNTLAASAAAGAPPLQVNYNYGQPQGPDYGQPMPYSQSAHSQQGYGHGYDDPKYANQVSAQPAYGGHGNPQPGAYSHANTQPGYGQQPYARPPAYGMQSQGPSQAYGPPRPTQPGEMPYQNPNPATHPYGQAAPSQQPYPYASGGPAQQQPYPYGSAPAADGYNQAQSLAAPGPGYSQQTAQSVPGYTQPGGQVTQGYAQSGQPGGGYGPAYSSSQQGYGEQPATNAPGYGYQAPADGGYGNAPTAAYNAAQSGHTGYAQPPTNQQGYDQPMAQAGGYGGVPAAAPPGYVKNVSPQPGYATAQYDSTQMYGGHH